MKVILVTCGARRASTFTAARRLARAAAPAALFRRVDGFAAVFLIDPRWVVCWVAGERDAEPAGEEHAAGEHDLEDLEPRQEEEAGMPASIFL